MWKEPTGMIKKKHYTMQLSSYKLITPVTEELVEDVLDELRIRKMRGKNSMIIEETLYKDVNLATKG